MRTEQEKKDPRGRKGVGPSRPTREPVWPGKSASFAKTENEVRVLKRRDQERIGAK